MYYLHHSATAFAAIVAGVIASTHAQAGSRVGGATSVVHDVASSVSGQSWAKKVAGDDVYEDEFIRTETESSARISFIDETDIRMGPAARMKIDRVVFKSGRSVSELVVTAEAGARALEQRCLAIKGISDQDADGHYQSTWHNI